MLEFNRMYFNEVEVKIVDALGKLLEEIMPNANVSHRGGGIRIEQEVGFSAVMVQFTNYKAHKIIDLTNIIIPEHIRPKGIGNKIINTILDVNKEFNYSLYITDITTKKWYDKLVKNGGIKYGEDGIYIDPEKWNPAD